MGEYIVNPGEKPLTSLGMILYDIARFLIKFCLKKSQPYSFKKKIK